MYHFHHKYIKRKYNNKAKSLITDKDSLIYEIATEDVYKDFWAGKTKCDNSECAENSPFNKKNKKVADKFKDEAYVIPILELVGLRSKLHGYIEENVIHMTSHNVTSSNV